MSNLIIIKLHQSDIFLELKLAWRNTLFIDEVFFFGMYLVPFIDLLIFLV